MGVSTINPVNLLPAVPGIVAQLVLIPLLLTALQKAGFAD